MSKCKYVTNVQLNKMLFNQNGSFTLLNAHMRSLCKNLDKFKLCIKTLGQKFAAIGLSEIHTQNNDKPHWICWIIIIIFTGYL